MPAPQMQNWKGSIHYTPNSVERVNSIEDICRIVADERTYPSPVRVKGSHHSTTRCVVADQGTVIDVSGLNRIIRIDRAALTITVQAGVQLIDAARALEAQGLQFYVNVELGNLTLGSGACGGTKDASCVSSADGSFEYGQVASYAVGFKLVRHDGSVQEISGEEGELIEAMRSSYGMLGIIVEATFRVKPIEPMAVKHVRYRLDEFTARLDELVAQKQSMMLYLFPFLDSVVVEYRYPGKPPLRSNAWQWRFRNWVWKTLSPAFGRLVSSLVPIRRLRSFLIDSYNRISQWVVTRFLSGCNTSPADQIIRYPETAGFSAYTFSIWAFPRNEYAQTLRDYYSFCRQYYKDHGFRCDMLNVGYHIAQDRRSLFSYTRHGPALTLDPVSTGGEGWEDFLIAYNAFCSEHNGTPLFNQTAWLTPPQVQQAFAPEVRRFIELRRKHDPLDRFYTNFFRTILEG